MIATSAPGSSASAGSSRCSASTSAPRVGIHGGCDTRLTPGAAAVGGGARRDRAWWRCATGAPSWWWPDVAVVVGATVGSSRPAGSSWSWRPVRMVVVVCTVVVVAAVALDGAYAGVRGADDQRAPAPRPHRRGPTASRARSGSCTRRPLKATGRARTARRAAGGNRPARRDASARSFSTCVLTNALRAPRVRSQRSPSVRSAEPEPRPCASGWIASRCTYPTPFGPAEQAVTRDRSPRVTRRCDRGVARAAWSSPTSSSRQNSSKAAASTASTAGRSAAPARRVRRLGSGSDVEVVGEQVQPAADLESAVDEGEARARGERVGDHLAVARGAQLLEQELDRVDRRGAPALEGHRGDLGPTVPCRHPGHPAAEADRLRLHRERAYALPGRAPGSGDFPGRFGPSRLSASGSVPIQVWQIGRPWRFARVLDLDQLLAYAVERGASDVHLKVGSPPYIRIDGRLERIEHAPVSPVETERIAFAIMPKQRAEEFIASSDADFAYSVSGVGRFRVNVMRQRGSVGLVLRRVQIDIPSFEALGLPPVVRKLAEHERGSGARDRPDRLRQDDDARLDDRLHQRDAAQAHRHDRGPDRDPASRQGVDRQPARGRDRHQ